MSEHAGIRAVVFALKGVHSGSGAAELARLCRVAGLAVAWVRGAAPGETELVQAGLAWDALVNSGEVRNPEPAPDVFLLAAGRLHLMPHQCVVVGDFSDGLEAAKSAGMRCVAVGADPAWPGSEAADVVRATLDQIRISDLTGLAMAPPIIEPLAEGRERDDFATSPAERGPAVWSFWQTLGLGVAIAGGTLLAQVFFGIVYAIAAAASGHKLDSATLSNNGQFLAMGTCASAPIAVGLCWLFAWLRKGLPAEEYLGLNAVSVREMARWCVALVVVGIVMDGLLSWLGKSPSSEFMEKIYETAGFLPLLWFALVVVAPISEEMLFRGFLYQGLVRSRAGVAGAIIIPAVLWAMIHVQYDVYGIGTILVLGILFGYARWKSQSICTTIYMHALTNLLALLEMAAERHLSGAA